MEILLSNTSGVPIYQQIVTQVRQMIMNGALTEGDSLPSMRLLAKELRISVITTKRAYEELESMGLLVSVAGKGCFVGGASPERLVQEQRLELQGCLERAAAAAQSAGVPLEEAQKIFELCYKKGRVE
ncbi:MAG: GntR family transcriptional regulator [Angelakisella sp.]